MIDQTTLITYLIVLLGFVFIPGPAVLLTLARASSSGTRVGLATGLGIAAGDLVHTAMAVLGISAVILTSAVLFSLIKYLGAGYLIYLGIRAILEKPQTGQQNRNSGLTPPKAFRQAVLAEVLNPKSALFFLAFLPQFVQPGNGAVALQLTTLGVLFVLMGLFSTVVVAIFAGHVGAFLRRNPAVLRWQGKVVGGIYCALGVRLALQER
ncbi:LysE family translocator [Pelagibius sp. Alg239-R121]|uniref:LysE family translocator n=1 Tax=Pelagibius sp. Alg239-R121 TaxID=2993448 RepID=UPI0024A6C5CE|nr:LysE family translocator [Pelagibius sp. Alg239-R121]